MHAKQREIDACNKRFIIVRAGRKFGKTTIAETKSIKWCSLPDDAVWFIGPTYKQVKRIAWKEFKRLIPREALLKKPNETELTFNFKNNTDLILMGSDDEDSLRGPAPRGTVLEEAASMNPEVWYEAVFPNLAPKKAPALFIGTPKGLNWFYDLWCQAERNPQDWGLFHFTIYDNPHISLEEIEMHRRNCPNEAIWRQEYMAEFESDAGRVFIFNPDDVFVPLSEPERDQRCYRAVDWGMRDQTVALWAYVQGGVIHVFREHAQSNLAASQQAELIKAKNGTLRVEWTELSHDAFRQDPQMTGLNVAYQFVRAGIPVHPTTRNKAAARSLIQKLLTEKKIRIDPVKCPMLRSQLPKLEWKDTLLEKTEDGNDDAVDALHYLVYRLAQSMLVTAQESITVKKEPGKLYLPERETAGAAHFSPAGDVVGDFR